MKAKLSILAVGAFILHSAWMAPTVAMKNATQSSLVVVQSSAMPSFSFFRTHRQGRFGVTSTWGLNSETGVQRYSLERTYEDPSDQYANWETVCVLPCSNGRSYKFTDDNVFPGFISYRVKASMSSGGEMTSSVSTVHIVSH